MPGKKPAHKSYFPPPNSKPPRYSEKESHRGREKGKKGGTIHEIDSSTLNIFCFRRWLRRHRVNPPEKMKRFRRERGEGKRGLFVPHVSGLYFLLWRKWVARGEGGASKKWSLPNISALEFVFDGADGPPLEKKGDFSKKKKKEKERRKERHFPLPHFWRAALLIGGTG